MTSKHFPDPAKKVVRDDVINVRVPASSKSALRMKAARKGKTITQAATEALRDWMAKP